MTALGLVERLVGSFGPLLIQSYLTTTHRNFPVIEEGFFSDYENGRISNLDPALLAAIYALTIPWLARETGRGPSQMPDVYQLEDLAFRLFGESLYKPTLSTLQAGILLLQKPNNDSKTLNSQLVGAAYELGLHLDCTTWSSNVAEKGLRKRLAWALYMQDKWCSLIYGRPSAISTKNWAVKTLTDEDFGAFRMSSQMLTADEERERGRALFKEMVSLTEILSTVLDTFYTLRAMQEVEDAEQSGTRLILERAKPVQIRLKEWFAGLPANLKIDSTMTGKPSSTGSTTFECNGFLANTGRVPTPGLLCDRDHSSPLHRPISRNKQRQPIPRTHMPLRSKDTSHLRHGLCQPSPVRASQRVLVFPVQSKLRPDRHVRKPPPCHSSLSGGSRVLPHKAG